MANTSAPNGFVLAGFLDGRNGSLGQSAYQIQSGYSSNIFSGDPVQISGLCNRWRWRHDCRSWCLHRLRILQFVRKQSCLVALLARQHDRTIGYDDYGLRNC